MNIYNKTILIIAACAFIASASANQLVLKNDSTWNICVEYIRNSRPYKKVLRTNGATIKLGKITEISNVKIRTYGAVWGWCSTGATEVDLTTAKKIAKVAPLKTAKIEVSTTGYAQSWNFVTRMIDPAAAGTIVTAGKVLASGAVIPESGLVGEAFNYVKTLDTTLENWSSIVEPRHVLDLPAGADEASIKRAAQDLQVLWHTDKAITKDSTPTDKEYVDEVFKVIGAASDYLLEKDKNWNPKLLERKIEIPFQEIVESFFEIGDTARSA